RVFGDRVWNSSRAGAAIEWVAPFTRMPLIWERAFGGTDQTEHGPSAEPRNPVGTGFHAKGGTRPVDGSPLPNIENPSCLLEAPFQTPIPAGFAPIAPHW